MAGVVEDTFELQRTVDDRRLVVAGTEHQEVEVPEGYLVRDGKVDLYDAVMAKGLFRVLVKGRRLVLQAGAFVGLIPINDRLAVEVRTRVPVANLERMLSMVADPEAHTLGVRSTYAVADEQPTSVLDLITDDFIATIEGLRTEGLPRGYNAVRRTGTQISGAILIRDTIIHRHRSGRPEAAYRSFERTLDTAANRLLRDATVRLSAVYRVTKNRAGNAKRITQLSGVLNLFEFLPAGGDTAARPVNPDGCAADRPQLYRAIRLANLVVERRGIEVRQRGGEELPAFLVNMEDLFESYVRTLLSQSFSARTAARVLDGNQSPPDGGASVLFSPETVSRLGNKRLTPDTLIEIRGVCRVVIETKYKPCKGLPSRDELSQVMAYGAAYNCTELVLAYPSLTGGSTLEFLGEAAGARFYKATLDMGSADLEAAERSLIDLLSPLAA